MEADQVNSDIKGNYNAPLVIDSSKIQPQQDEIASDPNNPYYINYNLANESEIQPEVIEQINRPPVEVNIIDKGDNYNDRQYIKKGKLCESCSRSCLIL